LEFAGGTADQYLAVNKILGVDAEMGEAQAGFMARLGPALSQAGVPQPTRMEWLSLLGRYNA
jgi:hypothetical protein